MLTVSKADRYRPASGLILVLLTLHLLFCTPLLAQPTFAELYGKVTQTAGGTAIPGANISLSETSI